jgi:N-acetylneuraminic acid mutarotase
MSPVGKNHDQEAGIMKRKLWSVLGVVLMMVFALMACSSDDDDKSSAKVMKTYSLAGATGVINEGAKTIAVTMPFGTVVTNLVATFTTSAAANVKIGTTPQVSGTTANNFSSPKTYTVTAEDGSHVDYVVTVTVAPSNAKAITAYSLATFAGTVNETAKTIAVTLPRGKDVTALVATFATSGTSVKIGTTVQVSGTTANNFTSAVTYTVTAADATTQNYVVTITYTGGTWTAMTDFGGTARSEAVAFGILNGKGYMGTGWNGTDYYSDFWEYDSTLNTWTQKANLGSTENIPAGFPRKSAVAFAIGAKGYVGTGENSTGLLSDFWEYDPATNTWTRKNDFGVATLREGLKRTEAVGFSIMSTTSTGKGYVGTGINDADVYQKDFWEFDPATGVNGTWTKKTDFLGAARAEAVGLSIVSKGYVGTGRSGESVAQYYKDFYEFDPATNAWLKKADFAGGFRAEAVALYAYSPCGGYGYVGLGYIPCYEPCGGTCECGQVCTAFSDFWEYDPVTDTWTQKAYYDGGELTGKRAEAAAFSLSSTSHFVGTGWGCAGTQSATTMTPSGFYKDFWKYVP